MYIVNTKQLIDTESPRKLAGFSHAEATRAYAIKNKRPKLGTLKLCIYFLYGIISNERTR